MKRREAMLKARSISERILAAVITQGKDLPEYRLSHEDMSRISADALDVTEYLCVPRPE